MTQEELQKIFQHGAGMEEDNEDSIAIGSLTPADAPAGIDAVMTKHTQQIDTILRVLPDGSAQKIQLLAVRGFTFSEYQDLFHIGITAQSYKDYAIFRYLWISSEKERKRFIYHLSKDRYEDYVNLLSQSLQCFHAFRLSFFFTKSPFYRLHLIEKFTGSCTCMWKDGSGKKQNDGINVF